MKKSKKSQLQMGETIAILIVFFILVGFGLMFYTKIMEGGARTRQKELMQLRAIQIAQRASALPEVLCSEDNDVDENCVDILKVKAAMPVIEQYKVNYYDTFGLSNITVIRIFPEASAGEDAQWALYEEIPPGWIDKKSTFIPVSLANYKDREHYFGIISVEVYSK